jgi:hypothetical protein
MLLFLVSFLTEHASAQRALPDKAFSIGVLAGEMGYDSGIGIELGTPSIFNNSVCFRIKGNVSWFEQYKTVYDRWVKYKTITGSLVYNASISERGRIYFDLGAYFVFPNQKFSEVKVVQGITCSTGIELFLYTGSKLQSSYYFAGGIGYIKAYADKMENEPRYGNGFVFNNGFRFYF